MDIMEWKYQIGYDLGFKDGVFTVYSNDDEFTYSKDLSGNVLYEFWTLFN